MDTSKVDESIKITEIKGPADIPIAPPKTQPKTPPKSASKPAPKSAPKSIKEYISEYNFTLFEYEIDVTYDPIELNKALKDVSKSAFNRFMEIILKKCGKQYIIKMLELSLRS